jgi:hypothetical protein
MNAELDFFGRRVSMAQRSRRRAMIVLIYSLIAILVIGTCISPGLSEMGAYVIWAAIFACRLFLGGYAAGGLVKPFNKRSQERSEAAPSLLALKLRIYQPIAGVGLENSNDERELYQRDRAHFWAYQILGVSILVPWITLSLLGRPKLGLLSHALANQIASGMLLASLALFLTLPQAILLWTEPDMEPDPDFN